MEHPWSPNDPQVVLVLVGLIASGKSTFAEQLERFVPQFRRCNQDDLGGNRRAVEKLARESLREGLSVCIDRTNVDETQRAHWINIARERAGTQVWCLVFDTPLQICRDRLRSRTDHPTIKSPEQGITVLHRFANDFRSPAIEEGFDRIMCMKPDDHTSPTYTKEELEIILLRIASSPPPPPPTMHQGQVAGSSRDQPNLHHFLGADRRVRGGHNSRIFQRGSGPTYTRSRQPRSAEWSDARGRPHFTGGALRSSSALQRGSNSLAGDNTHDGQHDPSSDQNRTARWPSSQIRQPWNVNGASIGDAERLGPVITQQEDGTTEHPINL